MAKQKLNDIAHEPKQVWEHINTGRQLLILQVEDDMAYCALLEDNKVTAKRVAVPTNRLKNWGNRGMAHVTNRKGKLPKVGDLDEYGVYNPRNESLGAV